MICKFCNNNRELIKAHVIPAGFFKCLRHESHSPRMLTSTRGVHPKRLPIGVYDSTIVCRDCESQFGPWDTYAQRVLKDEPLNSKKLFSDMQLIGYRVPAVNYSDLKLFFISMTWRASVSDQGFYKRIRLGPFEKSAKSLIKNRNPGDAEEFSVFLAKFSHPLGMSILDPHPEKYKGVNYVRFYLAGYVAYIKVDKRKTPMPFSQFMLSSSGPLYIVARNFERSKELPLVWRMVSS